ncbi:2-hydroxyacyl-CoA dehydratase subunit D [Tepidibacter hydrothermalis]|uniref:2-hydroxyacyl-CoA dehydratase family protein n=1 Tax=Tepidibacter hydrothermalis TaxID=3036126 RepID=A0ABY8EGV3_9FIRM|nr:2-hydroxyacyl-CoA dehydratase family protein [Tepidibacter hydrothermalis]WFD10080.1 2-hydroxyacyl-CoA dehydratase family protein [Tepidibacter hydrothermalis]
MNKKVDERILDSYKNNIINTLKKLRQDQTCPKNSEYFFTLAENWFLKKNEDNKIPKIGLIGKCIPEEMIYALGAQPVWILGGSFEAGLAADEYVPRDTDPVVRSTVGMIKSGLVPDILDCKAIIAPVAYDSERKMVGMLSKDMEVYPVEIPPIKWTEGSKLKWIYQIDKIKSLLEKKTRKKMNHKNLIQAVKLVNLAKLQIKQLMEIRRENPQIISASLMLFIMNTYYFNNDLRKWTYEMQILNEELKNTVKEDVNSKIKPRIFVIGSPIYFPNMKIPLLLEELGAEIADVEIEASKFYVDEIIHYENSSKDLLNYIALKHYLYDYSPYFIPSEHRIRSLKKIAREQNIKGVLYHILKGHLCYDFELEDVEEKFKEEGIPVFRIETDYNYEDIEQLRIRTEAVIEMLSAKIINH